MGGSGGEEPQVLEKTKGERFDSLDSAAEHLGQRLGLVVRVRSGDPATPAAEDRKTESAVLAFLLAEYPNQLTIPEVSWALNPRSEEFAEGDAVERAVRQLDGAGLLRCREGFVVPMRAALYYWRLEQD